MAFRHFRLQVTLRVVLLAVTVVITVWTLQRTDLVATGLLFMAIGVWELVGLIRYVERTNHDLSRFLESIRYSDFTQSFSDRRLGSAFGELYKSFGEVMRDFRQTRTEREEQSRYLHTVVQHIGVGLLAYSKDGNVELSNSAARRMLRVNGLRSIFQLTQLSEDLVQVLAQRTGGESVPIRVRDGDAWQQWSVRTTEFKLQERTITLASIQNIQNELDEKEMEAWQNLIRVLTHEIMNSVTPIASLAATADGLLQAAQDDHESAEENLEDIRGALATIKRRSDGLVHFVQSYRNLSHLPRPNLQIISAAELFGSIERLMKNQAAEHRIELAAHVDPPSLELTADPEMIEQILINLVLNAIQALEGRPRPQIELSAGIDERGRVWMEVHDNGIGMAESVQERIFIPFFTTKKSGSGIGLSLSRQIMRLHGGTLTVRSREDEGSTFTLRF